MLTIRETATKYINELPEDTLFTLLPLLKKLSNDVIYVEKVSFDELTEDEQKAVLKGRKEFESDELIDFEDYLKERGIN